MYQTQRRQRLSLTKIKPIPHAPTHNKEGSHQTGTSGGAKCWCPTSGTLAHGICIGEPSPQNVWVGKQKEQTSRGPKLLLETEIPLLEGSCVVSLVPRLNKKTADWKAPKWYVRDIHLLIWEHWLEGQGTAGALPGDGGTSRCHSCPFYRAWVSLDAPFCCLAGPGRHELS